MATQNAGVLATNREYPVTIRSIAPPRFFPARIPRKKPRTPDNSHATNKSQMEFMTFSPITSATGRRYKRDVPMFP